MIKTNHYQPDESSANFSRNYTEYIKRKIPRYTFNKDCPLASSLHGFDLSSHDKEIDQACKCAEEFMTSYGKGAHPAPIDYTHYANDKNPFNHGS